MREFSLIGISINVLTDLLGFTDGIEECKRFIIDAGGSINGEKFNSKASIEGLKKSGILSQKI